MPPPTAAICCWQKRRPVITGHGRGGSEKNESRAMCNSKEAAADARMYKNWEPGGLCLFGFYYAGRGYTNRIEHTTPREEVPTPTAILGQMTPNYRNRPWLVSQSGRGTDVSGFPCIRNIKLHLGIAY